MTKGKSIQQIFDEMTEEQQVATLLITEEAVKDTRKRINIESFSDEVNNSNIILYIGKVDVDDLIAHLVKENIDVSELYTTRNPITSYLDNYIRICNNRVATSSTLIRYYINNVHNVCVLEKDEESEKYYIELGLGVNTKRWNEDDN